MPGDQTNCNVRLFANLGRGPSLMLLPSRRECFAAHRNCVLFYILLSDLSGRRQLTVVDISRKRYSAICRTTYGARVVADPNCVVGKSSRTSTKYPEVVTLRLRNPVL
jgi:hypothetical protein